jgi:hypothetical protein
MTLIDSAAHDVWVDIYNDGDRVWVFKNQDVFAVLSPRWGGRLVALYSVGHGCGSMLVGNPCDDWNWMEELNRFMDVPRNHPGAFADVDFEHDRYDVEVVDSDPKRIHLRFTNVEDGSAARGLVKEFELTDRAACLFVRYNAPAAMKGLSIDCGLSPDYLTILRKGSNELKPVRTARIRGWKSKTVAVWLKPVSGIAWDQPAQESFGHGRMLRLRMTDRECAVALGVTRRRRLHEREPVLPSSPKMVEAWR